MTLNRTLAPESHLFNKFSLLKAEEIKLANGIPLYCISGGTQDVIKIELVFKAGVWYEQVNAQSGTCNSMLAKGTSSMNEKEISEKFDYFGSYFDRNFYHDNSGFSVYTLKKFLPEILKLLVEIFTHTAFPQKEFETLQNRNIQQLKVSLKKNDHIARRKIRELIFGTTHPYGKNAEIADFESLTLSSVSQFFQNNYRLNDCYLVVSGKVTQNDLKLIEEYFGKINFTNEVKNSFPPPKKNTYTQNKMYVEKPESVQSSIRLGRKLFTRSHPDYIPFCILNEVLGGYFGSRLMSNLREDKGFTYGINSIVNTHLHEGGFYIGTDVKAEDTDAALEEIYKEINLLTKELIPEEELHRVKKYMLGQFLSQLESPFNHAELFLKIHDCGLGYDYYDTYIDTITNITSSTLIEQARKYLCTDMLSEVVVGKKNV